eukprot:TRINITY_DN2373_c0_g1_i1.p1 TRINITY_DN2373_c0_g1~~TRINITY_DN2373_c0_g1_i1.p1  ORF type:complete len:280 (-),score=93.75 TRINITY_DN2373_c0_g1_i1:5-844(-)
MKGNEGGVQQDPSVISRHGILQEYTGHQCVGYNITCSFLNHERQIVCGSEDRKVYIYDRDSGKVVKTLPTHPSIVHLVHSSPFSQDPLKIVTSSIENCSVVVWSVMDEEAETPPPAVDLEESRANSAQRATIDSVMKKYGDKILKIFHQYNYTFMYTNNWQDNIPNSDGQMVQMISEIANSLSGVLNEMEETTPSSRPARRESRRGRNSTGTIPSNTIASFLPFLTTTTATTTTTTTTASATTTTTTTTTAMAATGTNTATTTTTTTNTTSTRSSRTLR